MPQPPATPGVYVQELPSQNKPIEGVGTSVAAFVGLAPWGPVNTPTRVTSWMSFERTFGVPESKESPEGPFMEGAYLAHAVYGFFQNGGGACWVVRVGKGAYGRIPQKALPSAVDSNLSPLRLLATEAAQKLKEPVSVILTEEEAQASDTEAPASKESQGKESQGKESQGKEPKGEEPKGEEAQSEEAQSKEAQTEEPQGAESPDKDSSWKPNPTFTVEVKVGDKVEDKYEHLTVTHGPKHLLTVLNAESKLVEAVPGDSGAPIVPLAGTYELTPPEAEAPKLIDLTGDSSRGTGLSGLGMIEEVTMVCVPDLMSLAATDEDIRGVQTTLTAACTQGRRMAILDPPQGLSAQQIGAWQQSEETPATAFATLYWPWIRVLHPVSGHLIEVPPCGHVAGVWARTDQTRGVFKAPANEVVMGAVQLPVEIDNNDQDPLNRNGVNCIRSFPGRGIRTWGARTLATDSDPEWKYINVRRLFNYLTASIAQSTSWAVFEPNDEMLWGQLRIAVTNFLMGVWREGGLFGSSPDQAFFVKCDAETNPQERIDEGQVNIVVGVAPVKPAEFVIFQVSQHKPAT